MCYCLPGAHPSYFTNGEVAFKIPGWRLFQPCPWSLI